MTCFVRGMRFELTRPFERYHLKVVRLPISPPTHPLRNFEEAAKIGLSAQIFKGLQFFSGVTAVPEAGGAVDSGWLGVPTRAGQQPIFSGRSGTSCPFRARNDGRTAPLCDIVR